MSSLDAFAVTREGPNGFGGNDDRVLVDAERSLFVVGDASGPTYGGKYAPLGADVGMAALARSLDPALHAHACDESCLRVGFEAAHVAMHALELAYREAFERAVAKNPDDRLEASLRACKRVAREKLDLELTTFAHFASSFTALRFAAGSAVLGQVGLCRAYRWRDGTVELLLAEHSLAATLRAVGRESEAEEHPRMSVNLLGMNAEMQVEMRTTAIAPGDRYVLCSDGIWGVLDDAAIAAACERERAEEIATSLANAAGNVADDDATVIAIVVPKSD